MLLINKRIGAAGYWRDGRKRYKIVRFYYDVAPILHPNEEVVLLLCR